MSSGDEFTLFRRKTDLKPSVIMARVLKVDSSLRFHLTVEFPYVPNDAGMPSPPVLAAMQKQEGLIDQALITACRAVFVGHEIGGGRFVAHFYAPRPAPSSVSIKVSLLKRAEFSVKSEEDPTWQAYFESIAPTSVERHQPRNQLLLQALAKHGDISWRPRTIDFLSVFPTLESAANFAQAVIDAGYGCDEPFEREGAEWGVEFHRDLPTTDEVVETFTEALVALSEQFKGELDGWACPVVRA